MELELTMDEVSVLFKLLNSKKLNKRERDVISKVAFGSKVSEVITKVPRAPDPGCLELNTTWTITEEELRKHGISSTFTKSCDV